MRASRASVTAVGAVVSGVLLMTLLVTWAASIGPSGVLTGEGVDPVRLTPSETESSKDPLERLQDRENQKPQQDNEVIPDAFRVVALVLEVLAGIVLLYLLYRAARWTYQTWRARRRPDPKPAEVDFDLLVPPEAVAEKLVADAAAQREVLLGGTPRNAVVEAWSRFETQAGQAGVRRQPWETSSEFTLRVLDLVYADSTAVAGLAALYRKARFSDHDISEADRTEALAALDAIHASLRSSAGRSP